VANTANTANSVAGANVSGQVANSLIASTVYTNAQPNITSVGLLTSLSVGPNSSITLTGTSGFVRANSIQGIDGVNAIFPGYNGVSGAAGIQTNLTVGVSGTGNLTVANITTTGSLRTDNLQYANGVNYVFTTNAAGSNTQIQFNDSNSFAGSANFTFNKTTNTLNVTNLVATNNANVSGNLTVGGGTGGTFSGANLVSANFFTGTLTTSAQPNITSVGALISLDVIGNTLIQQSQERFSTISGATGTVVHNFSNGGIFVHSSISANFTANITNLPNAVGRASVVTLLLQQGTTGRICSAVTISGVSQTIRWLNGVIPTPTNNAVDTEVFTIFQTDASTYIVLGQLGTFI
jgi:hypothetical protein